MNGNIIVSLQNINVSYGENSILENLNLEIKDKEFLTLLGPSGCGKTTILRTIAGFIKPDSGKVFFDGKVINDMPAYKREVNTVFQRFGIPMATATTTPTSTWALATCSKHCTFLI